MSNINQPISTDEAKAALASIELANNITVKSMRPPLWLVVLCAISLGLKTAAMGLMIHNILWNSIQWITYTLICLSIIFWIFALRKNGIKIKIVDVKITTKGIISALLICLFLILSRISYLEIGSALLPSIAGLLNFLLLIFCLRFNVKLNTQTGKNANG